MRPPGDLRRYAAPAAFLAAVTIAVVLVRSGLEQHPGGSTRTVVTSTAPTTPSRRVSTRGAKAFWTVRAGDTFGVIAAATGVPVRKIQRLNPRASSTTLFIGEKIRVR